MPGRLRREPRLMAEINVTALIDVMTVLLVIFMIVAPMAQSGMEVRVPRTEAAPLPSAEAAVVTLDRAGRVFVDRVEVRPEALGDVMAQVRTSRGIQRVYVQADEAVSYGQVAGLMGQIREAGFENVGLVFEPPPATGER
jgi:biopolymer transport protein TolR